MERGDKEYNEAIETMANLIASNPKRLELPRDKLLNAVYCTDMIQDTIVAAFSKMDPAAAEKLKNNPVVDAYIETYRSLVEQAFLDFSEAEVKFFCSFQENPLYLEMMAVSAILNKYLDELSRLTALTLEKELYPVDTTNDELVDSTKLN